MRASPERAGWAPGVRGVQPCGSDRNGSRRRVRLKGQGSNPALLIVAIVAIIVALALVYTLVIAPS